ncbi:MAG: hypothetical protein V4685_13290 [Bacteroidota bacterium]
MKGKWIVLTVLLAIIVSAFLYLKIRKSDDFEPQIKEKLAKLVSEASDGLYKLDISKIEIDITAGSITAKNILLSPDSTRMSQLLKAGKLGNNTYTISLKKLDLEGLSPAVLMDQKNISLDKLVLESPEIEIIHTERSNEVKDTGNMYEKMKIKDQSFSVKELYLKNIQLTVNDKVKKNRKISSFKNLSAFFTDIKIDSSTVNDSTRFLFAKDAVIFMKGFSQVTEKKKYHFDIDSIALHPQNGNLQFYDLKLKPEGTKEDFNRLITYQQDRYDIKIKKGDISNINWFSLLSDDGFFGDEVKIEGGTINIYHDRSLPGGPPKSENFPHQMLMKAGIPVNMKKVLLKDFSISYEELNPKSGHTGTVEFQNVNGEISNLTNISSEISKNNLIVINAAADFLNAGKLDAVFRFDLAKEKTGAFSVDATLGKMDGLKLNKITEGLSLVKIKDCKVDKLQVHITGTNKSAKGDISFAYHDLSFEVLKNDDGELKKRGVFSFIANALIVKNSNPSKENEKLREYTVIHEHDPSRSFFNLIWKTILDGILKTVK